LPFDDTEATTDATRSPTDPPSACISGDVPTVWYSYTAGSDGLVQAVTGGGFTTFLTVYDGQPGALNQLGCRSGGSPLAGAVTAGTTYYLAVTDLQRATVTLTVTSLLTMNLPGDATIEATGPAGAVVGYVATAALPDGTPAGVDCAPPPGSVVGLGDTRV